MPELRMLIAEVRNSHQLNEAQRKILVENFDTCDPVLVSLAAYAVGLSDGEETNLCAKAEAVLKLIAPERGQSPADKSTAVPDPPPVKARESMAEMVRRLVNSKSNENATVKPHRIPDAPLRRISPMSEACIRLLLGKKRFSGAAMADKVKYYEALTKDPNAFMRIEAAKELLRFAPEEGLRCIKVLVSDQDFRAKYEAERQLGIIEKGRYERPMHPDELYAMYLIVVEGGG